VIVATFDHDLWHVAAKIQMIAWPEILAYHSLLVKVEYPRRATDREFAMLVKCGMMRAE
jgi:hypothetical protein